MHKTSASRLDCGDQSSRAVRSRTEPTQLCSPREACSRLSRWQVLQQQASQQRSPANEVHEVHQPGQRGCMVAESPHDQVSGP